MISFRNFAVMKYPILSLLAVASFSFLLTSCEKKEKAIILPPISADIRPGTVNIGEQYETQIFYDFESNKVVESNSFDAWDLSFEASKTGYHVWMNGGLDIYIYNTHTTDLAALTELPAGISPSSWGYDDPGGYADSTAVGDWRNKGDGTSKNEVYIVKLHDTAYRKFSIVSADEDKYVIRWARLNATTTQTITLNKNDAYNFIYFSFNRGIVVPEPPKNDWDIVFTRYRHIYKELDNYPYVLNGVLSNPAGVAVAADSIHTFDNITAEVAASSLKTTARDIIGFDWKVYDFGAAKYIINSRKNYIVQSRNGMVFKLRFTGFYNKGGVRGNPSFETIRLQ